MLKLLPFCDLWKYDLPMSCDGPSSSMPWWAILILAALGFIPLGILIMIAFYLIAT